MIEEVFLGLLPEGV
jgi:hypothetical protein